MDEAMYWNAPTPTKPTVMCSDTAALWLKVPQYLSIWCVGCINYKFICNVSLQGIAWAPHWA